MTQLYNHPLYGETLITLDDAAADFVGIAIPMPTLRMYVYQGIGSPRIKLETIRINRRYTSREAIQRFIERRQNPNPLVEKPRIKPMTQAEVDAGLRRYGIIK